MTDMRREGICDSLLLSYKAADKEVDLMKKGKILSVVFALFFMLCMNFCVVNAANSGQVYLNAKKARTGIVTVSCEAQGIAELTNGKIRIRYAAEKLKLERSEQGDAVKGFMCQINDSISGTKPEGELVFVFASSDAKKADGCWLNLTLSMKDDVALTAADFSISVEELKNVENGISIIQPTVSETRYEEEKPEQKLSIANAQIAEIPDQTYNGKKIRPGVNVKYNGAGLKEGRDYVVSYSANKKIGKAKVTVSGLGNYEGSKTVYFYIAPKAPKIKKAVSTARKKISMRWGKIKSADGYQIQIASNKSFTKNVKSVKIKKITVISKKVKVKGKGKGNYYVRIRSYKNIDGKLHYGAYSARKKVRVK